MSVTRVGLGLATVALVAAAPLSAHAVVEHERSEARPTVWYHWPDRVIPFYVSWSGRTASLSPGHAAPPLSRQQVWLAADHAFSTWKAPCTDLQFIGQFTESRLTNMNSSETDGRTLVVVRNQDWFGATSCDDAIACTLTRTVSSTGEIIDSDIDLNAEDNSFSDDPSRFPGTIDLQTVLAHEVGHVLGFGHSDEAGTLMYATLSPGVESERRALSPDAQAIVCETYPANGCTVVDDRRDTSCGGPWDPPGCGVGGRATDPGALGGMVGLGLVALSRRARRSSRGSRASCRASSST